MKIEKEKMSRCIILYNARVKKIEQKCFIYHQMYHGDWESHRECMIKTPALIDDVTE